MTSIKSPACAALGFLVQVLFTCRPSGHNTGQTYCIWMAWIKFPIGLQVLVCRSTRLINILQCSLIACWAHVHSLQELSGWLHLLHTDACHVYRCTDDTGHPETGSRGPYCCCVEPVTGTTVTHHTALTQLTWAGTSVWLSLYPWASLALLHSRVQLPISGPVPSHASIPHHYYTRPGITTHGTSFEKQQQGRAQRQLWELSLVGEADW